MYITYMVKARCVKCRGGRNMCARQWHTKGTSTLNKSPLAARDQLMAVSYNHCKSYITEE